MVAYPTESVYGLGCDPFNRAAVERILQLKQRPVEKGLILVAADPQAFTDLVELNHQAWSQRVLASWQQTDQAITWLLPKRTLCPAWISGEFKTLAVRVVHHPLVQALCGDGVLVSTSANPAHLTPALNCQQVSGYFGDQVFCLEGELGCLEQPSQIWDAVTNQRIR